MKQHNKDILIAALALAEQGFSIIPVGQDKKPLIKWERYQAERATPDQIQEWSKQFPNVNIGIVTGAISGIVVLDFDKGHGHSIAEFKALARNIPTTVSARSGGGGEHVYFKHPGWHVKTTAGQLFGPGVDVRGDGGYVVVAPSLHPSGNRYEWIIAPGEEAYAELPQWLVEKITVSVSKKDWQTKTATGAAVGVRNTTATEIVGKLLSKLPPEMWDTSAWDALRAWNQRNDPPLDEKELGVVFDSIKAKETERRTNDKGDNVKDTIAALAIKIIDDDKETVLFHDELGEPFIRLNVGGHKEIWRFKSKQFRRWISSIFWNKYQRPLNTDALNNALNVLEGRACFECEEFRLSNRVAILDNVVWYDLADKDWRAVKITTEGWNIVADPPIMFKRYPHQDAQYTPVSGGNVRTILEHVNITDSQDQLLFLVYLVSCFIPGFPHPVPNIYGGQGSAKSTVSKLLRKLVDPSRIEAASLPSDLTQLAQLVAHHWFLCFDNISWISPEQSDLLCKVVSGSGFSKRELYTDDEDIIYAIQHCLVLNGINLPATRPDLLQRSILFELPKVPDDKRRDEGKLFQEFEKDCPLILGAIFDAVSRALKIRPTVDIPNLPRMADFMVWGCAITEALGYSQDEFQKAYRSNIAMQNDEALAEHVESSLLIDLMEDRDEWFGRYSELLDEIKQLAKDQKIDEKLLPKSPNSLSRRLNELKPNLAEAGYEYSSRKGKGGQRIVTIRKESKNTATIAPIAAAKSSFDHDCGDMVEAATVSSLDLSAFPAPDGDSGEMGDIFSGL